MVTGDCIRVTSSNILEYGEALVELGLNRDRLAAMTRKYPLECCFVTYRCVFVNGEEIDQLISALARKLDAYKGDC